MTEKNGFTTYSRRASLLENPVDNFELQFDDLCFERVLMQIKHIIMT